MPIYSGYFAGVFWDADLSEGNAAYLTWEWREFVEPGAEHEAVLKFLHPELLTDQLEAGRTFWLCEGRRVVAQGVILG